MERLRNLPCRPNGPDYVVERDNVVAQGSLWSFKYAVVGRGTFPADMLRHDASFPADTESACWMTDTREARRVVLRRLSPNKNWLPTFDRWRSFGWMVETDV